MFLREVKMNWKNFLKNKRILSGLAVILALIVVVASVSAAAAAGRQSPEVTKGVNYLKNMEARKTSEVDQILQQQKAKKAEKQKTEMLQKLSDGTIDVWSLFKDAAVMGDSRAVGYSYYKYLPESKCFAKAGATIRNIHEYTDQLKKLNPSLVFFCYGLNDIGIGFWKTPEAYAKEYKEVLDTLHKELPNTKFFVSSTLPAQKKGLRRSARYKYIPQYSKAVGEMCEKAGYGYVDCTDVVEAHKDLYDLDGIHLQKPFYPYWAAALMTEYYQTASTKLGLGEGEVETDA